MAKPGGYMEYTTQRIIVDPREVPKDFDIDPDDYVILQNHDRYEVKSTDVAQFNGGITLYTKRALGAQTLEVSNAGVKDRISMFQIGSAENVPVYDQSRRDTLLFESNGSNEVVRIKTISQTLVLFDSVTT